MMMRSPPRSPRSVRCWPSLMTIPEGHACAEEGSSELTIQPNNDHHHAMDERTTALKNPQQGEDQQQQAPLLQQPQQLLTNHDPVTLINAERARLHLSPLICNETLDALAYRHAAIMAKRCDVHHSVERIDQLQHRLGHLIVGENVQRGDSVWSMHYETIWSSDIHCVNRANLLSAHFGQVGSATVRSLKDGKLYCCQLFRGTSASASSSS
jgi:uncharacterized protein YkwD